MDSPETPLQHEIEQLGIDEASKLKCKTYPLCVLEFSTQQELDEHCRIHFPDCEHLFEDGKCRFCKELFLGKSANSGNIFKKNCRNQRLFV